MVTYQTTFKGYLLNLLSFFDSFTQSYNYGFTIFLGGEDGMSMVDTFPQFFYGLML